MSDPRLTAKQRLFCFEYLVDLSATQAAIRAGYSKRSAASIGEENLRKPEIRAFIAVALREREKRIEIRGDQVVQELAAIAFSRITDFVDIQKGRLVWHDSIDLHTSKAVLEIYERETSRGVQKRIRLHDKLRALELLGRHLGIFSESRDRDEHRDYSIVTEGLQETLAKLKGRHLRG